MRVFQPGSEQIDPVAPAPAAGGAGSTASWEAAPTVPREARHFVEDRGRSWRVDRAALDTAVLLTSEVVTSAVANGGGSVRLRAHLLPARGLHVEVDQDGGTPTAAAPQPTDPDESRIRGLALLPLLADDWGCTLPPAGGTTVWFDILSPEPD